MRNERICPVFICGWQEAVPGYDQKRGGLRALNGRFATRKPPVFDL